MLTALLLAAAFAPESLLAGAWDNAAQFAAAPAEVKAPPSVNGRWLDRQHARFFRVDAPLVGERVFYLEWRSGGPEGAISRQRIWRFLDGPDGTRTDYYLLARPERFAGRGGEAGAFRALRPDELTGYGDECAVRWARQGGGYAGRVDPRACRITARSGRAMRLDVAITLEPHRLIYSEQGVLDDGGLAFAVPSAEPYRFERADAR